MTNEHLGRDEQGLLLGVQGLTQDFWRGGVKFPEIFPTPNPHPILLKRHFTERAGGCWLVHTNEQGGGG